MCVCEREGEQSHFPGQNLGVEHKHFILLDLTGQLWGAELRRPRYLLHLPFNLQVATLHDKHVTFSELSESASGVVREREYGAAPDDGAHRVGVLYTAHEEFSLQEEAGGDVGNLFWVHKPWPMEPRITTGCVCVCVCMMERKSV